ncbi:hypothetical protein BHE97_05080 [Aeromicrobium sp. PE09-221]|nr:hypothetical protein BHE97_05080 [Aeromicrobium sp. PE09-221]
MTVTTTVEGAVGYVTLDRPADANALDLPTSRALEAAVAELAADERARVVVLRGNGRVFCAGGDLAAMMEEADRGAYLRELVESAHRAVEAMQLLGKPLVVAVQGAAAGIGFSFALGADLVVATESAKFVTAYTSVGLTPDGGMSWLLPRAIGQQRALDLIVSGRPLPAAEARDWGIVGRLCADDALDATVSEAAAVLADRPVTAIGRARRLVRSSWERSLVEHLGAEAESISSIAATDEAGERITRFLKR